ncbi:hypothetical protein H1Q63_15850 [Desmonostoc muscorum CCALA 125]|nr:hypothetical protein [Desmonostoc muscorum CCALA 125]
MVHRSHGVALQRHERPKSRVSKLAVLMRDNKQVQEIVERAQRGLLLLGI